MSKVRMNQWFPNPYSHASLWKSNTFQGTPARKLSGFVVTGNITGVTKNKRRIMELS